MSQKKVTHLAGLGLFVVTQDADSKITLSFNGTTELVRLTPTEAMHLADTLITHAENLSLAAVQGKQFGGFSVLQMMGD